MEKLLHYTWKHRLLPLGQLTTTDGRAVEVIDPGLYNRRDQGPDFFNAKVRIGGTLWVGNIELHLRSSDWYLHHHDRDAAYNNVVLHVVSQADADVLTENGLYVPQVVVGVPEHVRQNYEELLHADQYPPCYRVVPTLPKLMIHSWMAALQTERLEQKTEAIAERARQCGGSWEQAYFVTLSRNFGFGINGDAFEQWARAIPLQAVAKHRDDLFQVEAIFLGQAGFLAPQPRLNCNTTEAEQDDYSARIAHEYSYLSHKFGLQPIDAAVWRFLRLRPQNFPYIRISQLARLFHEGRTGLSALLECSSVKQLRALLQAAPSPYWQQHYTFGKPSRYSQKQLSAASVNLLCINTAIPMLFAVGRHRHNEQLCDRAFDLLEQLHAEQNHIIDMWARCGLEARTAGDSQALLQLKTRYCDRRDCLRCRFGYEYLRKK